MILVDGSYLYELGKVIQPLSHIKQESTNSDAWAWSYQAKQPLEDFLTKSVYVGSIRLLEEPARTLLTCFAEFERLGSFMAQADTPKNALSWRTYQDFSKALSQFEAIFRAEFRHGNMYLVTPKGGFETRVLIQSGEVIFPQALPLKCKDAIHDVREGTKCLAFELYTASGFHLHRANESVIKSYYRSLAGEDFKENERNLGKYITRLEQAGAPKHISSCLRDLKDMHRNPLMHPDQSIETVDDAIALLYAIHTSINGMLKEIPDPVFNMEVQES